MFRSDVVAGVIFIAASIIGAALSFDFPSLAGQSFGPNVMPRVVLAVMGIGGLLLLFCRATHEATDNEGALFPLDRGQLRFFGAVIVGLLVYGLALDRIGFIPLTLIFSALVVRLSGGSVLGSCVFAVVCTFLAQWVFGTLLRVPLPPGLLGS